MGNGPRKAGAVIVIVLRELATTIIYSMRRFTNETIIPNA
jgi:hypothetical protein